MLFVVSVTDISADKLKICLTGRDVIAWLHQFQITCMEATDLLDQRLYIVKYLAIVIKSNFFYSLLLSVI